MSALRWRRATSPPGPDAHPQAPLVSLAAMLLAFESSLYSAVTPVLPHYAHTLHASKPALGLLSAAYPAGLIPGSLLGGWVATRIGVRRTTLVGLVAFGVAVAAFGFAVDLVALDGLRVLQGASCGLIWGGALTWVIAAVGLSQATSDAVPILLVAGLMLLTLWPVSRRRRGDQPSTGSSVTSRATSAA